MPAEVREHTDRKKINGAESVLHFLKLSIFQTPQEKAKEYYINLV